MNLHDDALAYSNIYTSFLSTCLLVVSWKPSIESMINHPLSPWIFHSNASIEMNTTTNISMYNGNNPNNNMGFNMFQY